MLSLKEMSEVRLTADSPGYVSVWEIEEDLYDFSNVINKKYSEVYFDFVFCFRALYTTRGIRSKVRFEKDCNCLGMDLIMSLDEFNPYKNNVSMQRRIMGKHFFPFFAENIKKLRKDMIRLSEKYGAQLNLYLNLEGRIPDGATLTDYVDFATLPKNVHVVVRGENGELDSNGFQAK